MKCSNCNEQLQDDSVVCPFCGTKVSQETPLTEAPSWNPPSDGGVSKPRFSLNKKTITAGIAALLVLVLLITIVSLASSSGPVSTIFDAASKTLNKGNFTVDLRINDDWDDYETYLNLMVDINMKEHELTMYGTLQDDYDDLTVGIYDDYLLEWDNDYEYGSAEKASSEIETMFESYEGLTDRDNVENLLIEYGLDEIVDLKEFEKCLDKYIKKLDTKRWLKENASYRTEKENGVTYHTLRLDDDFLEVSLEFFESAFYDADDYDDLYNDLRDFDGVLTFTVGIKSGYLVSTELKFDGEDQEMFIEFTDIGKTKIDMEQLEDLLRDCD